MLSCTKTALFMDTSDTSSSKLNIIKVIDDLMGLRKSNDLLKVLGYCAMVVSK